MNSKKTITFIGAAALCFISACSKPAPHVGESVVTRVGTDGVLITEADSRRLLPEGKLAGQEEALVQLNSTVTKINYPERMISLKSANGEVTELVVSPEAKNFNQIKVGDTVSVNYIVSLAFEVRKPTVNEVVIANEPVNVSARAKLGEMPAAGSATGVVKVGKIESIDQKAETVTISGISPLGPTIIKAKYPENLNYVHPGDMIVVTMVQAFATSVTRQ